MWLWIFGLRRHFIISNVDKIPNSTSTPYFINFFVQNNSIEIFNLKMCPNSERKITAFTVKTFFSTISFFKKNRTIALEISTIFTILFDQTSSEILLKNLSSWQKHHFYGECQLIVNSEKHSLFINSICVRTLLIMIVKCNFISWAFQVHSF